MCWRHPPRWFHQHRGLNVIGQFCVVRCYAAGVVCGIVEEASGQAVKLTDCRIIHRWRGARTTLELSLHGADEEWTRISEPVATHYVLDAISVTPCTPKAEKNLRKSRWGA